jgi:hypothetical protein
MAVTTPEWLTAHGGELRPSHDGRSWGVYFAGELQYVVMPVPARGAYGARVTFTINGRRLEHPTTYPTAEGAVRGGLDDLRKDLGW